MEYYTIVIGTIIVLFIMILVYTYMQESCENIDVQNDEYFKVTNDNKALLMNRDTLIKSLSSIQDKFTKLLNTLNVTECQKAKNIASRFKDVLRNFYERNTNFCGIINDIKDKKGQNYANYLETKRIMYEMLPDEKNSKVLMTANIGENTKKKQADLLSGITNTGLSDSVRSDTNEGRNNVIHIINDLIDELNTFMQTAHKAVCFDNRLDIDLLNKIADEMRDVTCNNRGIGNDNDKISKLIVEDSLIPWIPDNNTHSIWDTNNVYDKQHVTKLHKTLGR